MAASNRDPRRLLARKDPQAIAVPLLQSGAALLALVALDDADLVRRSLRLALDFLLLSLALCCLCLLGISAVCRRNAVLLSLLFDFRLVGGWHGELREDADADAWL